MPAANHRVAWVHPFMDGNGRTIRLMADAAFKDLGMHVGLWSPSRGLARSVGEYKRLLSRADQVRQGSMTDGRGALSEQGLIDFCAYYLDVCIDQVAFMRDLFDVGNLLARIEKYCHDEHERSKLSKDAFLLLRETGAIALKKSLFHYVFQSFSSPSSPNACLCVNARRQASIGDPFQPWISDKTFGNDDFLYI